MAKQVQRKVLWGGVWLLALSFFLAACGGLPDGVQLPESPLLRVGQQRRIIGLQRIQFGLQCIDL